MTKLARVLKTLQEIRFETRLHTMKPTFTAIRRVLRPEAPVVYIGAHPCFVGPHSLFLGAEGVPALHRGYRPSRRYDSSAPGVANPEGLRARVDSAHLPLDVFLNAFLEARFQIERLEELGDQDYPHIVALRARR